MISLASASFVKCVPSSPTDDTCPANCLIAATASFAILIAANSFKDHCVGIIIATRVPNTATTLIMIIASNLQSLLSKVFNLSWTYSYRTAHSASCFSSCACVSIFIKGSGASFIIPYLLVLDQQKFGSTAHVVPSKVYMFPYQSAGAVTFSCKVESPLL